MTTRPPLTDIAEIALEAGRSIMELRAVGVKETYKPDGSPVTDADLSADRIINMALNRLTPQIPRITEETWSDDDDQPALYWCVDPLDGTKGFINGGRDFTVNIALIEDRYPILGIIYAPALGKLWAGDSCAAWMRTIAPTDHARLDDFSAQAPLKVRAINPTNPVIVATKAHRSPALEDWINRLNGESAASVGSSLKFCEIAMGHADIYPRISPTMEWDTAAGQAILESAGGMMVGADGKRFFYGKAGRINPPFAAMGKVSDTIPSAWLPPPR